MSSGIFLIQDNDNLVEMMEQPYDSEDLLQELLAKYPRLLSVVGSDMGTAQRWVLISREMPLASDEDGADRWSVDHLFLDQNAIPTLVEVKRSSDTRIRREVVGQMLDYAANAVVYWPLEKIRAEFESKCEQQARTSESILAETLGIEAKDQEAFWQNVKTNLKAGKIRMIFVADDIPAELRRIVEFLNEQMDPAEVLAIEIRQYGGQGLKTLVPRAIGQTSEAEQKKGSATRETRQWDEQSFFQELEARRGTEQVAAAKEILQWARATTNRVWWGKGTTNGSFVPVLNHKGKERQLFAVWTNGYVEIYFYWYAYKPPFDSEDKRRELLARLNSIEGVSIPEDAISRRPSIPLAVFTNQSALRQLLQTFEWFISEIRAS